MAEILGCRVSKKTKAVIESLLQDIEDMSSSLCTRFERCPSCKRIHDAGYVCWHCGCDSSTWGEE